MSNRIRPEHPMPEILNVASFMRRFGDNVACAAHPREILRRANPERFVWDSHVSVAKPLILKEFSPGAKKRIRLRHSPGRGRELFV